ncbi:MAG: hypothetical protein Q7S47_01095 [bacterium]|nr:hypothetical protein [bacterium]
MKSYQFKPDLPSQSENEAALEDRFAKITISGSHEFSNEKNIEVFGEVLVDRLVSALDRAKNEGKTLIFDMATGSTPAAMWPILQKKADHGLDLSGVIIIGHEEAWGSYASGSHSDFDGYRKREFFERNTIPVREIRNTHQLEGDAVDGNFIPMHQNDDPGQAAVHYGELLRRLEQRDDIRFFGLYGVGTDGHIGEVQIGAQGVEQSAKRSRPYVDKLQDYSFESADAQLFRWNNEQGEFLPYDNVFWERQSTSDVGRAARENYGGMECIMGIGWKDWQVPHFSDSVVSFKRR